MVMAIKNMYNPNITVTEESGETDSRVDIFIWEINYKETGRKDITFEENNKRHHSMILKNFSLEL